MNPVLARFVACGGNDAALIRSAADDYRFAAQFRPFQQFHRNEKRVHIHVKDGRRRLRRLRVERPMLCAKASEIRHTLSLRRRTTNRRLARSEEHTSELQSRLHLVCRLLLEKKTTNTHALLVCSE